jgi:hypothetical protein
MLWAARMTPMPALLRHDDGLPCRPHQGRFCDRNPPILRHFPHSLSLRATACGQHWQNVHELVTPVTHEKRPVARVNDGPRSVVLPVSYFAAT